MESFEEYLQGTPYVDDSFELRKAVEGLMNRHSDQTRTAVPIFDFVRDIKWGASSIYKASEAVEER